MRLGLVAAATALVAVMACGPQAQVRLPVRTQPAPARSFGKPELFLVVRDARVKESSGLAASPTKDEWLYTHNDSGDSPRVFRIGKDGRVLAEILLPGIQAQDCEDIASARVAGVPMLYLGDIGDNEQKRRSVFVHRFREPGADGSVRGVETFELVYPDGARDAEAPGTCSSFKRPTASPPASTVCRERPSRAGTPWSGWGRCGLVATWRRLR